MLEPVNVWHFEFSAHLCKLTHINKRPTPHNIKQFFFLAFFTYSCIQLGICSSCIVIRVSISSFRLSMFGDRSSLLLVASSVCHRLSYMVCVCTVADWSSHCIFVAPASGPQFPHHASPLQLIKAFVYFFFFDSFICLAKMFTGLLPDFR